MTHEPDPDALAEAAAIWRHIRARRLARAGPEPPTQTKKDPSRRTHELELSPAGGGHSTNRTPDQENQALCKPT